MGNGYESYYYHSVKGIWLALRAKVYFFDNYSKDINFWQSGGAVKINLWHGIGNKRINYDNKFDKVRHPKNLWENGNISQEGCQMKSLHIIFLRLQKKWQLYFQEHLMLT